MDINEIQNSEEYKNLQSEIQELKEEYKKLKTEKQPIVYTQSPDKSLEMLVEKGADIVTVFIEQQTELEKAKAETDKYEIDKTYGYKEKELTTRNSLVKRQMNQQTIIIVGGIVITGILAFTGNLTDGFLTIIAVIIGAAIKDNIIDFVKDIAKTTKNNEGG